MGGKGEKTRKLNGKRVDLGEKMLKRKGSDQRQWQGGDEKEQKKEQLKRGSSSKTPAASDSLEGITEQEG